jgi:membrane protease YdiL (CAAX protease family)
VTVRTPTGRRSSDDGAAHRGCVGAVSTMPAGLRSSSADVSARGGAPRWLPVTWTTFVVAALLLLSVLPLPVWAIVISIAAVGLLAMTVRRAPTVSWLAWHPDPVDMMAVGGMYAAVVTLFRIAFVGFTADHVLGLFLTFAGGLILGVAGPVVYTTWIRRRPLRSLGLTVRNVRPTLALAVLFGGVQFVIMFWGHTLPAPVDWVPLLVLSVTVGLFEAVFFRGFVQGRLEAGFGPAGGVVGAAVLYALYHVGYGMPAGEMVFLFGLGVVYAIAYRLVENILVLWPLLTPIGAFFNNLQAGDIVLPWASILGFADVIAVMGVVIGLAVRRERAVASLPRVADAVDV